MGGGEEEEVVKIVEDLWVVGVEGYCVPDDKGEIVEDPAR